MVCDKLYIGIKMERLGDWFQKQMFHIRFWNIFRSAKKRLINSPVNSPDFKGAYPYRYRLDKRSKLIKMVFVSYSTTDEKRCFHVGLLTPERASLLFEKREWYRLANQLLAHGWPVNKTGYKLFIKGLGKASGPVIK